MRVLITGAKGFVGPHLINQIAALSEKAEIIATSRKAGGPKSIGNQPALDVTNEEAVDSFISDYAPTHIVHLAGIASLAAASTNPKAAWRVHLDGTLNIAKAMIKFAPDCRLLYVGSGMVYGASALSGANLDENALLQPIDEYAATKAAADLALGAMLNKGIKVIRARPFNHTGPGQNVSFAAPSFAMQIARIEAGLQPPEIKVGNLMAERDLLDVRDVASAYATMLLAFDSIPSGTVLNVASGKGVQMRELLNCLLSLSSAEITITTDETRIRNSEIQRLVGDAKRANRLLDWMPRIDLKTTMKDLIADCRQRVAAGRQ